MAVTKKTIRIFNNRIKSYDSFTTEKEIEVEFYSFIKKYYENKYTKNSEGKINYTAPHNIDGLLEIRTLDHDYRILVEAKAHKDYFNQKIRNEVLSQAIYYCRKLNHYGEVLPSVIILLERKSMVIIKIDGLGKLPGEDYNGDSACGAHQTDAELIESLNALNYHYTLVKFNGKTKYNKVFQSIEELAVASAYTIGKSNNFRGDKSDELLALFCEKAQNRYRYYNGGWYIFDGVWRSVTESLVKSDVRKFSRDNYFALKSYNSDLVMGALRDYCYVENIFNVKFNNFVYNYKSNEFLDEGVDNFYNLSFPYDKVFSSKSFRYLNIDFILNNSVKVFIKTSFENYIAFTELAKLFNKSISEYNIFNGEDIVVYESDDELSFKTSPGELSLTDFVLEELNEIVGIDELLSILVDSYDGAGEPINYADNTIVLHRWRESGDNINNWFNKYLKRDLGSFVLLEDLRISYNNYLTELGYSPISHKVFIERFSSHSVFREKDLKISRGRTGSLTHSVWVDTKKSHLPNYSPNTPSQLPTHVKYIAFTE